MQSLFHGFLGSVMKLGVVLWNSVSWCDALVILTKEAMFHFL